MKLTDNERKAIEIIVSEFRSAKKKHPKYPKDPIHQVSIMCEESGEALQASLEHCYEGGSLSNVDDEVVETGAMALRYLIENKIL